MRIGIIGAGYVGLVTGVCLAEMGNDLTIADVDERKIAALRAGQSPHFEPGMEELLAHNHAAGRLRFTTDPADAARDQDAVFLAVGTPMGDSGAANLQYLEAAASTVARALSRRTVVIIKSTVPVGTNRAIAERIRVTTQQEFALVSNPEFLKEGAAINDFMRPDRVVIGVREPWAEAVMQQIYAPFVRSGHPVMVMDPESAEMVKYASNAMLASRISFMNEVANLCSKVGANVELVRKGVGADRRLGGAFLFPGLGYGGSCFPKDVRALVAVAEQHGTDMPICRAIDGTNVRQRLALMPAIIAEFGENLTGKRFAFWGVAFKAQTDDIREAPAVYLAKELRARGATVVLYDPQALDNAKRELGDAMQYADNAYAALEGADALVVCTDWNEFRSPDFPRVKASLSRPLIFDGRNLYNLDILREAGFHYYSIGRPAVIAG
ncbi:MAG: UDP-glucose/GDP-mannose dehydrogenase family protein [Planctomycetes bacterium]|nr:UDP-glucose/GDP-mannose dehydrogenase family protein [Planctomycetota bacterium]